MALGGWGPLGVRSFSQTQGRGQRREKQTDHETQMVSVVWALQTPLCPLCRPLARSSEVFSKLHISSLDWLGRPRDGLLLPYMPSMSSCPGICGSSTVHWT